MGNAVQRLVKCSLYKFQLLTIYFVEKYDLVGKLLKPGEKPTSYSDEEDEPGSSDKSGGEEKVDEKTEDDTKPEE